MNQVNIEEDSRDMFSYEFCFWVLVVCIIFIAIGFLFPFLYLSKYVGLVFLVLVILIRFIKSVFEMDR
ncbi:MAG: hypothetical protein AABX54_01335 [Nanoarchaeota archaeon]